jgi:hypothetical protein
MNTMNNRIISKNFFKYAYYRLLGFFNLLFELVKPPKITDYKEIPIIINNFNRLESVKKLIASLEKRGYKNIFIIDNLSTYPPLLQYYDNCKYPIFRLEKNLGKNALWLSGIYNRFKDDFFVYSDSDIVPIDECPDDFLLFFLNVLKSHKFAQKIGFSLKIDDLPDCYSMKQEVISYEQFFYKHKVSDLLYFAPIDTTFALYRPRAKRRHANYNIEMYRTAYPYEARHLPWYIDSNNPDDENLFFVKQKLVGTAWSRKFQGFINDDNNNIS